MNWTIDPFRITDYRRTDDELEFYFVFCAVVAGKTATTIAPAVSRFFLQSGYAGSPFERIRSMIKDDTLRENMERARLGKYTLLDKCFRQAASMSPSVLRSASLDKLVGVPGFGFKSARFFVLHSRAEATCAVIDTHVLKFLRSIKVPSVPSSIPTGDEYIRLERIMISEAVRASLPMAEFDLRIWTWYSLGNTGCPDFVSEPPSRRGWGKPRKRRAAT